MDNRPPSIDRLLRTPEALDWVKSYPRAQVAEALRGAVARLRTQKPDWSQLQPILEEAELQLKRSFQPSLRPVLNATGILIHTNLGRSPLSKRALEQVTQVCQDYCNLEIELEDARRGQRHQHLQSLLRRATGSPAALLVNNCAAALLLIVDEFARGREVLVSRGELVEIGGSFRIPEVLARGGARLVEVGTTNRTYARDFEKALTPDTSMLLSTHLSNFSQSGFVESPSPTQLVELARQAGILSVFDLGSGLLHGDLLPSSWSEPSVSQAVADGWDLMAFSGDKLLGSAQAGIILGRPELLSRLERNPWMRALRLDKLRLAALQGSLMDHLLQPENLPLQRMLQQPLTKVKRRAQQLAQSARAILGWLARVEVCACTSSLGGGTTPGQSIDSWAVCLTPNQGSLEDWSRRLRLGDPSVLTRIQLGRIWLDLRTLPEGSLQDLRKALEGLKP